MKNIIKEHLGQAIYLLSNRRPWRLGYGAYRRRFLYETLHNESILENFRKSKPLPGKYGFRLDARSIEIPWVLSRVAKRKGRLLDAGSALNHEVVLTSPALNNKQISIVTLAPEPTCFYSLGVSYVFGDLRDLYFKDESFDTVTCISTIEHVGMDNTRYVQSNMIVQGEQNDFLVAIQELRRVVKKGGTLYITFPFGRYENHVWFQQFNGEMVDKLVERFNPFNCEEAIYKYDPDGWKLSDRIASKDCEFFDVHTSKYFDPKSDIEYPIDYPAGERAVACLELQK